MNPLADLFRALFARRPRVGETWVGTHPCAEFDVVVRSVSWRRVTYEWDWAANLPPGVAPPPNEQTLFDFKLLYRRKKT